MTSWFEEIISALAGGFGGEFLYDKLKGSMQGTLKDRVKGIAQAPYLDKERGKLWDDLRQMQPEDRDAIVDRLRRATEENNEDLLVKILLRIPDHQDSGRREGLEFLNYLLKHNPQQFEQMIELLKDNPWEQAFRRISARFPEVDWRVARALNSARLKLRHSGLLRPRRSRQ